MTSKICGSARWSFHRLYGVFGFGAGVNGAKLVDAGGRFGDDPGVWVPACS